jgi:membrane-associated phospholipid phosphatase
MMTLRAWETASLMAFGYSAVTAVLRRGVPSAGRFRALGASLAGCALVATSVIAPANVILHAWLLPPALLFLFYWTTGVLFVAPMRPFEDAFVRIDRALGIREWSSRTPTWLAEVLEAAYAGVFALIPIAFVLYLCFAHSPDSDRFWTVILVTDFVCFGFLPWIQTRPPRALEAGEPWHSSLRSLNLKALGAASIHVNTFPSGHAAEALAAALLLAGLSATIFASILVAAAAVAAGAVFGRYHYAVDAFAGWLVALTVWIVVSGGMR